MKLPIIVVFIFCGLNAGLADSPANDPCDDLKVRTEINYTTGDLNKGRLKVEVEGGMEPYYYVFFDKEGKPLTEDINYSFFNFSSKETIYCRIMDGNGCKKTVELIIK